MHTFLHAFTAIHTFPYRNVKEMPKSSQHEDFGIALTFGWFGDVFLSVSVQNLAILANSILTFYKVGVVLSVAKRPLAPQHKTHNNQHEPPPPYPHQLLPLPPWVGQRCHQIMVPPLSIGLRKARAIGLGGTTVNSLVWGANASHIKK